MSILGDNPRLIFSLPWPPSANASHVHRKARVKLGPKAGKLYTARMLSDESRAYRGEVEIAVRASHRSPLRLDGRLSVALLLCPPDRRRIDIDNRAKQTLDALQAAKVFLDDAQVDELAIFRGNPVEEGRVLVSVSSYDAEAAAARLIDAGLPAPWMEAEVEA